MKNLILVLGFAFFGFIALNAQSETAGTAVNEPQKKACCASKSADAKDKKCCSSASASASTSDSKGEKANCAGKTAEGKACCSGKSQTTALNDLKPAKAIMKEEKVLKQKSSSID
jgi:hypothetical protein